MAICAKAHENREEKRMSKVAIVYWSGTGHTKKMAEAVKAGAESKGAEGPLFAPADFDGA